MLGSYTPNPTPILAYGISKCSAEIHGRLVWRWEVAELFSLFGKVPNGRLIEEGDLVEVLDADKRC